MKIRIKIFIPLGLSLVVGLAPAAFAGSAPLIHQRLNQLLKQYDPHLNIGMMVQSLTKQQTIYRKNATQLFMPASILKILPAIAALTFLGEDYRFHTKILTENPQIKHGTINNDLYFYFDGDPSLTSSHLDLLIKKILALGVTTINGNIYIDDTIFDDALLGAGWVWEDLNYCYAAPISAIILDKNCFALRLSLAEELTTPVIASPPTNYISITNNVRLKNSDAPYANNCALKLYATTDNHYYLSGCLKNTGTTVALPLAIRNIRLYISNALKAKLQENQIQLRGRIEFKKLPQDKTLGTIAAYQSAPLATLIKTMLKKSDNTIADAIYKKLGFAFFNQQATWQSGAKAIKQILAAKIHAPLARVYMDDGSGLSRYNLITPELLIKILSYAYYDQSIKKTFIESLANAGIDGTLQYRMPHLKHRLYAKTGTNQNTSALAGYIKTKSQEVLAFVIIINSFYDNPKQYHKLQNDICTLLANTT